jgi:hypothetical protein
MREDMLLHGIQVAVHVGLRILMPQLIDEGCDEQRTVIALHLTNLLSEMMHELPLPLHGAAKVV